MAIHWEQAIALYLIVRILQPSRIVETGVGRSTCFMLQALEDMGQGELYSIDINPSVALLIPRKLTARWRFVIGSSRHVIPQLLQQLGYINIFFHDSDHSYENMLFEFKTAWPSIVKGGILLSHDTDLNTAFNEFSEEICAQPIYLGKRYRMED